MRKKFYRRQKPLLSALSAEGGGFFVGGSMKEKEEVLGIDKTALTPEFNNKLRDLLACRGHGRIGEIDRTMAAKFIGA